MQKLLKNILASALPQIMNILSNLILPALIISRYGSEVNGLVSSTKVIVSYISIVGAGISSAVTQSLYIPVAKGDIKRTKGMLHAANIMFNKFGVIYCIIALVAAFVYPFSLDTNIRYITIVLLMIVISISGASEFFAIGRCRALLYANQKTYVCAVIQAVSLLGSLLLALLMICLDADIVVVQFAISFVYVLRAVFLTGYVRNNYPELNNYREEEPINAAVAKRKDAMIHQLSGLAVTGSQTTILTVLIGLEAASVYSVYNIVYSGFQSIFTNLCTAVTTFIGRELALNNHERLLKMYDLIEFAFFSIVAFVYSVTAIMVIPFIELYTKGADINYIYPAFAEIFALASGFYILKMPSNSLINISGRFRETRWRAILEASLVVGLGIVFTYSTGINGVVISTGIALCWRCVDTIAYTNKYVLACTNFKSMFRLFRVVLIIVACIFMRGFINITVDGYADWIKWSLLFSSIIIGTIILNSIIFDLETIKLLLATLKSHKL